MNPSPYLPVPIPVVEDHRGNKPVYIYASAVVLLVWTAVFGYLTQAFEFGFAPPCDIVLTSRSTIDPAASMVSGGDLVSSHYFFIQVT